MKREREIRWTQDTYKRHELLESVDVFMQWEIMEWKEFKWMALSVGRPIAIARDYFRFQSIWEQRAR
jgi:hypothetical protein